MAVYGIEGTPGSGKTLYAISSFIAPFLQRRNHKGLYIPQHIFHNIEGLQPEILCNVLDLPSAFCSSYIHKIGQTIDENGEVKENADAVRYFYKDLPDGAVVIIDEAQNYFGSRDFKLQHSTDLIPYLSRHRHYKHTVVWLTQHIESVDITFRRQTQYIYRLERLENYGFKNSSIVKMYEGWTVQGVPPYAKKTFKFPSKFFPTYKSYETVDEDVKEYRRVNNIFTSHKGLMAVAVLVIIMIIILIVKGSPMSAITKISTERVKAEKVETVDPVTNSLLPSLPPSPDAVYRAGGDSLCYLYSFVSNYETFYKLNNGQVKKGGVYNECN